MLNVNVSFKVFLDDMGNGLCFRYYFSSHKTRKTSQWNTRKHLYPFSDFYFHGE